MSETDDRMERAERIRKMRQSREPTGTTADETDDDGTDGDEIDDETEPENEVEDAESETETEVDEDEPAGNEDETADDAVDTEADDTELDDGEAEASEEGIDEGETATEAGQEGIEEREVESGESETDEAETEAEAGVRASAAPTGGVAPLGRSTGFSLPEQGEMEAAVGADGTTGTQAATGEQAEGGTGGTASARGNAGTATEPSVRVLEFTVGEQIYCIDIERVEEIVKREAVTRVPNTDDYVEGVVDLRGQITTILDTKRLLDVEAAGRESLLVVFAPDAFEEHGTVGWVVDEVRQVVPVAESQVRTPPGDDEHVRGVVDREDGDELVVWVRPGAAMSRAVDVADVADGR